MGFPRDLDEYSDDEIRTEYMRRLAHQKSNTCFYCGRPLDSKKPCKLNAHTGLVIVPAPDTVSNPAP